jgi:hypothetical protein
VESVLPSPVAPSFVMSNVVPPDPAGPSAGAAAGDSAPSVLVARPGMFVAYAAHTAARTKSALIALRAEAIFAVQVVPLRRVAEMFRKISCRRKEARLLCTRNGRLAFAIFRQWAFLSSCFYRMLTSPCSSIKHMSTSLLYMRQTEQEWDIETDGEFFLKKKQGPSAILYESSVVHTFPTRKGPLLACGALSHWYNKRSK